MYFALMLLDYLVVPFQSFIYAYIYLVYEPFTLFTFFVSFFPRRIETNI